MDDELRVRCREEYARICTAAERAGRESLRRRHAELCGRLDALSNQMFALVGDLQRDPQFRIDAGRRPGVVEEAAAKELDALARLVCVKAVAYQADSDELVVTTTRRAAGRIRTGARDIEVDVRCSLADGSVRLEFAGRRPGRRKRALDLLSAGLRSALAPVGAALIASGEIACLMGVVTGETQQRPAGADLAPVDPAAREAFVRFRAAEALGTGLDRDRAGEARMHLAMLAHETMRLERDLVSVQRTIDATHARTSRDWRAEFDHLCRLPRVVAVTAQANYVEVETESVLLRDAERRQRYIGRFLIHIEPGTTVWIANLDRPTLCAMDLPDHPHVQSRRVCWGNMAAMMTERMAMMDLPTIVQQSIELLWSYNPGSRFAPVDAWPLAETQPVGQAAQPAAEAQP